MATTCRVKKRVRVTRKPKSCPNPLFEKWLIELKEDAARKESKLQYVYGKALKSLQKYPLVLESAKECKVLQHFGDGLCKIIEKKLTEHISRGGSLRNHSESGSSENENPPSKQSRPSIPQRNPNHQPKEYIPTRRSGAYALLMALHKHATADGYLKKKDLQELAQPYTDVSFCQTDVVNAQYYSAWSSMTTLINKELVDKKGNPAKYQLTEKGKSLACRLDEAEATLYGSTTSTAIHTECDDKFPATSVSPVKATSTGEAKATRVRKAITKTSRPNTLRDIDTPSTSNGILQPDDLILIDDDEFDTYAQQRLFSNSNRVDVAANPVEPAIQEEPLVVEEQQVPYTNIPDKVTLKAGEYDIVLCVDIAEVSGSGSGKNQKETAAKAFQNCGVSYDVRKLSIGDYLWICKPKASSGISSDQELTLPYVVERKRMDDVVSSIKDGRFKEQKFRLKHSGLVRPIYLIEEFGNRQNLGLPETSVLQAIANTLIIEKFQVQWTQKSDDSVAFLVQMTKQLTEIYHGKTVTSRGCQEKVGSDWQTSLITFKELYTNSTKLKPLSVTQMFAKQLMQLHGLSGEKAEAIVKVYPTPSSLMDALRSAGASASTLLSCLEYGKAKRKIGLSISALLAKLYTEEHLR
ncbi:crossover junction endonuclease MUS81-like isoform X2 [Daphnia carinata]|uniref:crossover junction endonuclease MUS81-like isoform X2 n=1 Tax=Daphnia carinata TaxID=120202 RepID=UPI00257CA1C3|nr:crossover junction endonuclease MUS81-like isoform X2 [Daphnia carinata]